MLLGGALVATGLAVLHKTRKARRKAAPAMISPRRRANAANFDDITVLGPLEDPNIERDARIRADMQREYEDEQDYHSAISRASEDINAKRRRHFRRVGLRDEGL